MPFLSIPLLSEATVVGEGAVFESCNDNLLLISVGSRLFESMISSIEVSVAAVAVEVCAPLRPLQLGIITD